MSGLIPDRLTALDQELIDAAGQTLDLFDDADVSNAERLAVRPKCNGNGILAGQCDSGQPRLERGPPSPQPPSQEGLQIRPSCRRAFLH